MKCSTLGNVHFADISQDLYLKEAPKTNMDVKESIETAYGDDRIKAKLSIYQNKCKSNKIATFPDLRLGLARSHN